MSKRLEASSTEGRNRSSPTTARRILKRLWKSYKVTSCADGTLRITPAWNKSYGKPGLLTRMYSAALVEDVIHGR